MYAPTLPPIANQCTCVINFCFFFTNVHANPELGTPMGNTDSISHQMLTVLLNATTTILIEGQSKGRCLPTR
eukprot:m.329240 g.329240  ORF g.329240 m.329240 type:complete len:72 (+) comp27705_c0_seq1:206-421(+)